MEFQEFIRFLPINNFHRFDDPDEWFFIYSQDYPTDQEREEIYRTEDWVSSY